MGLSCEYDYEPEPGDVCWGWPDKMEPLPTRRSRKCCSCGARIEPGAMSLRFKRWKVPEHDVEIRIYGEDSDCGPPRPPLFHCFDCGNLALFLLSPPLNYGFNITDDMRELAKEHAEMARDGRSGCI